MRLTEPECLAISEAVLALDPGAEVWLYGSRVRDDLKGGDIDLLIVSTPLADPAVRFSRKLDLLVDIKSRIGDQRIDLTLVSTRDRGTDPWAIAVLGNAVRIH